MNEEIKKKLVALEAEVDALLFRRNMYGEEEDQQGMGAGTALKAGALAGAAGAGGYGAYLGDRSIMRKYGMMTGGSRREAYRQAGMDVLDAAKGYGAASKTAGMAGMAAGKNAFYANASKGGGLLRGLWGGIRKGIRVASGGRIRLAEIEKRITELSAQIELAHREDKSSYVGSAAGGAAKGAAAAGALGALGLGGLAAMGIKVGSLRSPAGQGLLRALRRSTAASGVEKDAFRAVAAPALIATASGVGGVKAAKYGALVGGGIGIGRARSRKQEQG